ncbi:unnamed protein product [Rotaria magnacalcarata]|uniref:ADP ribosyltransferase domain-containing protein n=1 Tax=Rotaria magnacalcarata TaxID=392030 RepID=A0A819V206_9BILA|nr:unnamed protein product [Rotaria magnacalcarata]
MYQIGPFNQPSIGYPFPGQPLTALPYQSQFGDATGFNPQVIPTFQQAPPPRGHSLPASGRQFPSSSPADSYVPPQSPAGYYVPPQSPAGSYASSSSSRRQKHSQHPPSAPSQQYEHRSSHGSKSRKHHKRRSVSPSGAAEQGLYFDHEQQRQEQSGEQSKQQQQDFHDRSPSSTLTNRSQQEEAADHGQQNQQNSQQAEGSHSHRRSKRGSTVSQRQTPVIVELNSPTGEDIPDTFSKKHRHRITSNNSSQQEQQHHVQQEPTQRPEDNKASPELTSVQQQKETGCNQDDEITDESCLPLKLFAGNKESLSELHEEFMTYLWLRRIKEIFLHMGDGKNEQDDDPFVQFDMNLAKTDLANICDRYIKNDRLALAEKDTSTATSIKTSQQTGSLQHIQDFIKQFNDLIDNPSSANLLSLLNKCIESLQELDKNTQKIIEKLRKQQTSNSGLAVRTILELIRSLQVTEGKKEKSDLDKKQEWDMKKLYAEVFKMSYKRNRLKTEAEQEELKPLKKGDDQPNFGNSIWWYSCDKANIYYQINSILRLKNFELLMSYRYYLSDLCRMIEFMYETRKSEKGDVAQTFYRASSINKKQLEKMNKQQKGQFISLLGFISTTTNIKIAKGYAQKQHISKDNGRVLFEIHIEPKEPCTAFAYIKDISFHPEEEEVLFSMGSMFAVDSISEPNNDENFHTVKLKACEIDKTLVDGMRTKVKDCSPSGRAVLLAQYLIELGEYRAARKYLNSLLTQSCDGCILVNDPNLAAIHSCLGTTYARQSLHGDALKAFKEALNAQARLEYSNNNALANIHNNIGLAYIGLGHLDEAKETLAKALRIQLRELNSNQQHLASIYGNIGHVHFKQRNFNEALNAFAKAEKIYKQSSSKIAHDALEQSLNKAEYLTNYGQFLCVCKSSKDANKRYTESLNLYKNILPNDDPKLMQTHINIMLAYAQNKNYSEVINWFENPTVQKLINKQEITMFELSSSITQASLAFLHEFVGACYAMQKSFDQAIDLWTRTFVFKCKARLEQLLFETAHGWSSTPTAEQKDLINKGYSLTLEHFKSLTKINESKENTNTKLCNDFCLGLLYVESYSREKSIQHLREATKNLGKSEKDSLLVTYLLLANIFKRQHNYKEGIKHLNQALELIKSLKTQKDRVLEIDVQLTRADCFVKDNNIDIAIDTLKELGQSLRITDNDTKRISLNVIVYDTLARYCLMQKNYELFDDIANHSISIKRRSFSQYHPSVAMNLILIAQRHIDQSQYHRALDFYEDALAVQNLNFTSNHPSIRKTCYAVGNIYCKLDKLSNAMEKYEVAENASSHEYEDNVLQQEKITSEDAMDIVTARISMHRNLAEIHAKKQAYKEAVSEMHKMIDLLKEELPSSTFDMDDETIPVQTNMDKKTFIISLKRLANCYCHLGDLWGLEQDDQKGYIVALNIYEKLFQYDEIGKEKLTLLCNKVSSYYEDLGQNEDALGYLRKSVELEQPNMATLYKLGQLNFACEEPDKAITNYEDILSHQSINEQIQIKNIIQEKLNEVQKAKKSQRRSSTSSTDSDTSTSNNTVPQTSNILRRASSRLTVTSRQNSEVDLDKNVDNKVEFSDNRAKAAAYYELQDYDMSMKYYEKDIKKRNKNLSDPNIFKEQVEEILQNTHKYEQQDVLFIWPKLFHSLFKEIRGTITIEDSNMFELADSFFQCALIYDKSSSHIKSIVAYISGFGVYASKSPIEAKILITKMENTLSSFVQCHLTTIETLQLCELLLPSDDSVRVRLKIAAMYCDNEIDDVEDLDGDDNTCNESRIIALEDYKKLLKTTNDLLVKGVCYYNILDLYKNFIYEDDEGKKVIDDMINWLPKFTNGDRRLLISLAIHFLREYSSNEGSCDMKIYRQLQKLAKDCHTESVTGNDKSSIGDFLIECKAWNSAKNYWDSIAKQIKCDITGSVLSRIHDSYSRFDEILHMIQQPEENTISLFNELTNAYEMTGDYLMHDAKNDQTKDRRKFFEDAQSMYEKALNLLKRLERNKDTVTRVDKKQQTAASKAKKAK